MEFLHIAAVVAQLYQSFEVPAKGRIAMLVDLARAFDDEIALRFRSLAELKTRSDGC